MNNNQCRFKLLQYFSISSAIAFTLTIVLLSWFYYDRSINHLVTMGEKNNVALTQSFANTLWRTFASFLTKTATLDNLELKNHAQTVLLNDAVTQQMQGLSVAKVKIYDLQGRTVFSTDPSQIGQDQSQSVGFQAAIAGQVSTQLNHQDNFRSITGTIYNSKFLSSYIPIYNRDRSQVQGVFELYNDVTPLIKNAQRNQINMVLGTTAVLASLYLGLFVILKKADTIIEEQKATLLKSQEEHKHRAKIEALAAEQAKTTAALIDQIRRSLDLNTIFANTARELRHNLKCDRLIIYQFNPDWSGHVIAESVNSSWISLLKAQKDLEVTGNSHQHHDRCTIRDWSLGESADIIEPDKFLQETKGGKYVFGKQYSAVNDIYRQGFPECYLRSLEKYQAKAYLIVPIFQGDKLWGLLGAYQNDSAREWQELEIELVRIVANQFAIALQQVNYIEQLKQQSETEKAQAENLQQTLVELKTTQNQLIQQEKLAALGQLVAGIAHEINTPLGAIQASAGDSKQALKDVIDAIPKLTDYLDSVDRVTLFQLLEQAINAKPIYSFSQKRPLKRKITSQLKDYHIDNARTVADLLLDIGIYEDIDLYLSLLKHSQANWILNLVYNLSSLMSNNRTTITSVEKAAKVVFALKNYARFDHSDQKQQVDITTGIETVLEIYRNQLKQNIEVERDYQDTPEICCYPDELIQIWTNLIHNSIQAMEHGGTLLIATASENNGIRVEISDSGSGIPQEIQEQIFEPFFTTKPTGEGSGLGLHISQKIVDKHQGSIAVTSQPGATKFSVWLPISCEISP